MRIAIIIATLGRPEILPPLLKRLDEQTRRPDMIFVSVRDADDLPEDMPSHVSCINGSPGSCSQRNRALDMALPDFEIVVFYDDDFVPSRFALARIATFFSENPGVVGANGSVLADGVSTGGITDEEATKIVTAYDEAPPEPPIIERDLRGLYGCNMAFRATAIGEARFDENLPLYGWQEDIDFTARLLPRGRLVKTNAFAGVHRGVTHGRSPGLRLGYSQMVNPAYLVLKGTMDLRDAIKIMAGNFIANHLRMFSPEPWVDRAGRARGNWCGLLQISKGQPDPMKVLELR